MIGAALLASAGWYVLGRLAHEATHVLGCWLTGSRIERIRPLSLVTYDPPSERAGAFVRVLPVVAMVPISVQYGLWLIDGLSFWNLTAICAVAGYLPCSETDWQPVYVAVTRFKGAGYE